MASNCCDKPIIDPWNTWEGICSECKEHCSNNTNEDDET